MSAPNRIDDVVSTCLPPQGRLPVPVGRPGGRQRTVLISTYLVDKLPAYPACTKLISCRKTPMATTSWKYMMREMP